MNMLENTAGKSAMLLALVCTAAEACTVCVGGESNMVNGMNMAIVGLLSVVAAMLLSFGAFFIYLNKKSKSVENLEGGSHA